MLDGALRGRNELIQDSIRRDTGIVRDRKQVSSHLQVLKHHLHNFPSGEYISITSRCEAMNASFPRKPSNARLVASVVVHT
jgi:hypothetical protein